MLPAHEIAILADRIAHMTRCAHRAAERAASHIDSAKAAIMDIDTDAAHNAAQDSSNAANSARSALKLAEETIYNAAIRDGRTAAEAHAAAISLAADAREYARSAATAAALCRKAYYMTQRKAATYSTRYN